MVKSLLSVAVLSACAFLAQGAEPSGAPANAAPANGQPSAPSPAPDSAAEKPAAPAATPDPAGGEAKKPAIKHLGGPDYELGGIRFNEKTRAITLPAKVNMTGGLLEYALVHESGKAHESLLTTAVSPYDLNVVLLLLNYQPSATFFDLSDKKAGAILVKNPKLEPTAQLRASLEWKTADGKNTTAALESLILNIDQKGTAKEGPFTYTGSMLTDDGVFMAKETGSILALYADAASLINNPRDGNDNDDAWIPDKTKIPAKDTEVTLTFSPATPAGSTGTEAPESKDEANPPDSKTKSKPKSKSKPEANSKSKSTK